MNASLVMVYNADSGFGQAVIDTLHKWFSPSTYSCQLCQLTYHSFGIKSDWAKFLKSLPLPVKFFHRDEFTLGYPDLNVDLPAIFVDNEKEYILLLSGREFEDFNSIEQLQRTLLAKLNLVVS